MPGPQRTPLPGRPPPDRGYQRDPVAARVEVAVWLVCAVLFAGALTVAAAILKRQAEADQRKQDEFISRCIEKHTEKRCMSFYKYGRQDLGQ